MAKNKIDKRKAEQAADQRKRRKTRREAGMCADCGNYPAVAKSTLCSIHKAQRAASAKKRAHLQQLARASMAQHEYDLRMQLNGGKCEGCHEHPATHFNFEKGTDKLLGIVCKGDDQILSLLAPGLWGVGSLLGLAGLLASSCRHTEMSAMTMETRFIPQVAQLLDTLRRDDRINATVIQPTAA